MAIHETMLESVPCLTTCCIKITSKGRTISTMSLWVFILFYIEHIFFCPIMINDAADVVISEGTYLRISLQSGCSLFGVGLAA